MTKKTNKQTHNFHNNENEKEKNDSLQPDRKKNNGEKLRSGHFEVFFLTTFIHSFVHSSVSIIMNNMAAV